MAINRQTGVFNAKQENIEANQHGECFYCKYTGTQIFDKLIVKSYRLK